MTSEACTALSDFAQIAWVQRLKDWADRLCKAVFPEKLDLKVPENVTARTSPLRIRLGE